MSHLDEGTLHAMLDGELSGDEVAQAQAHLEECAQCRALLDEARDFLGEADILVESLDEPTAPAAPAALAENARAARAWYRRPQVLSLAATVALAIGASFVVYRANSDMPPAFQRPASAVPDPVVLGEAESQALKQNAPVGGVTADSAAEADGDFRAAAAPARNNAPPPADTDDAAPQLAAESSVAQEEIAVGKDVADRKEQVDAPAAPAPSAEAERDAIVTVEELAREDKARDSAAAKRERAAGNEFADMAAAPAEADNFTEMVQTLGGSIRLIDGKQAVRYEQVPIQEREGNVRGDLVRVIYQDDQDREFSLEQVRLVEDEEQNRLQDKAEPEAGAGGRGLAFLSISFGDTVVSRESEGLVRIRWVDGDFLLSLVGVDEDYLRSQMEHIR